MIQVQQALANIGIPVMAGVWKPTSADQNPPAQYAVYSTTMTEKAHYDNKVTCYETYVYLTLWSTTAPTAKIQAIRSAMYAAGFAMMEESDKGYNQPAYDTATDHYCMNWTWVYKEMVSA